MNKKIDLIYNGKYLCSTMQSEKCWQARFKYLGYLHAKKEKTKRDKEILKNMSKLKAFFDKEYLK